MARRGRPKDENVVVFEVYVSNESFIATNLELPPTWSFYPSE